jgi:hypothetical protein
VKTTTNFQFDMTASTAVAFMHARTQALVIVPTVGFTDLSVEGDVRPNTDAGKSRAWSPPV